MITLVISTIVVSFVSLFISGPVRGFTDQARRVGSSMRPMRRWSESAATCGGRCRTACVSTTSAGVAALEMLSTVDGARYRAQPPGTAEQILDFAAADAR